MTSHLDTLLKERDRYNHLMFMVLEWRHHLKKNDEKIVYPLTDEQKQKDNFLFRYYETQYNKLDDAINKEIRK